MKMFLISDNNDTVTGLRLAGVVGEIVRDEAALENCLKRVLADGEIGILLLTEKIYEMAAGSLHERLNDKKLPLVVTIPGRGILQPAAGKEEAQK